MKSLTDEIVALLQTYTYPVTVKRITKGYSKLAPVYPMIAVFEINNSTYKALLGREVLATVSYQIDIYSKDMLVNGVPTSSQDTLEGISGVIDEKMNSVYGFTRQSSVAMPSTLDATVLRQILRYSAILDATNDITYR